MIIVIIIVTLSLVSTSISISLPVNVFTLRSIAYEVKLKGVYIGGEKDNIWKICNLSLYV